MASIWTAFLIFSLAVAFAAWLAALLHERGIRPLRRLAAACRRPIWELAFGAVVAGGFIQSGSTKGTNGVPNRETSLSPHGQEEEMVEMEPVLRGETVDVPEAITNADWLAFGAYEDWFHIQEGACGSLATRSFVERTEYRF